MPSFIHVSTHSYQQPPHACDIAHKAHLQSGMQQHLPLTCMWQCSNLGPQKKQRRGGVPETKPQDLLEDKAEALSSSAGGNQPGGYASTSDEEDRQDCEAMQVLQEEVHRLHEQVWHHASCITLDVVLYFMCSCQHNASCNRSSRYYSRKCSAPQAKSHSTGSMMHWQREVCKVLYRLKVHLLS